MSGEARLRSSKGLGISVQLLFNSRRSQTPSCTSPRWQAPCLLHINSTASSIASQKTSPSYKTHTNEAPNSVDLVGIGPATRKDVDRELKKAYPTHPMYVKPSHWSLYVYSHEARQLLRLAMSLWTCGDYVSHARLTFQSLEFVQLLSGVGSILLSLDGKEALAVQVKVVNDHFSLITEQPSTSTTEPGTVSRPADDRKIRSKRRVDHTPNCRIGSSPTKGSTPSATNTSRAMAASHAQPLEDGQPKRPYELVFLSDGQQRPAAELSPSSSRHTPSSNPSISLSLQRTLAPSSSQG
jgi:hypothetical protein